MIRFTGEEIAGWTNDALLEGKFGRVATKKGRVFEGWLFIEWQTMPPVLFVKGFQRAQAEPAMGASPG
jgi:hypothetical protein